MPCIKSEWIDCGSLIMTVPIRHWDSKDTIKLSLIQTVVRITKCKTITNATIINVPTE